MDGYWKAYCELNGKTIEEATQFILGISQGAEKSLWYFHPFGSKGKGPHIHGLLLNWSEGIDDTFRGRLKAFFNIKGKQLGVSNNFKKGTPMDENSIHKYITYMSKGIYDPFVNKGFDKDYLDARKAMWVGDTPDQEGSKDPVEKTTVKSKITQYGMAQLAKAQYMEEYPESYIRDNGYEAHKLVKIVIKVLKDNQKLAHKIQVRNIVQDIEAEIDPVRYVNDIVKML